MNTPNELDASTLDELAEGISGNVLTSGNAAYDSARSMWNARFDRGPDAVVQCRTTSDVVAAIAFARARGLRLSVKGGGHQYAGNTVADGGLLIDLGPMKSIEIDVEARTATAGAGATWGDLDGEAQAHALATPGGTVSTVGIAGLTLGGGEGWLTRKHGLTCDNLLAAEVVTASGKVVRASESENADLHWALRGGGGNFGVVTSFEYRLHPVGPDIVAGQAIYPAEHAPRLLRFYRDTFRDAPDALGCFPFFYRVPPIDPFPPEAHGDLVLAFVVAWVGPLEEAGRHLDPFRSHDGKILDNVGTVPYAGLQQAFDAGMGGGNRWYTRAHYFDELTDSAIDTLVASLEPFPGEFTTVYLGPGGGAVGRMPVEATAYPHRTAAHSLHVFPGWIDAAQDDAVMAWARSVHDGMATHANGGVYVNLLGEDESHRVRAAYGSNYDRLSAVKRVWDPDNLFVGNHNIPPAD